MEYYLQSIFPGQKNVLYRIFPYAVHTFRISNMHIVQINVSNCVQSLKSQKSIGKIFRFLSLKSTLIFIILFHKAAYGILIVLPVRILHVPVSQKIGIYCPGNSGFLPL